MKKAAFFTLGCKVNQYETQAMTDIFAQNGFEICDFNEVADVYVVNSCTVTGTGDKKSRQAVHKAKRLNPNSVVALVGCYAQSLTKEQIENLGADVVLGTGVKDKILDVINEAFDKNQPVAIVEEISKHRVYEETPLSSYDHKTRALLKIQDGCDRYCAYCIIPYVRGPIRSREMDSIIKETQRLAKTGFKEIVLAGIQVAAYGKELKEDIENKAEAKSEKNSLIDVIENVASVEGIERIRLSSLEPLAITDDFLNRAKATNKLCHSFHLSLQSGCDSVLKRMNRRYTCEQYYNTIELIRKYFPDAGITTDVIVGFPGETLEEFEESLNFVEKIKFSQVHVFPFSPREGTKAATMEGQFDKHIKDERAKIMGDLAKKLHKNFLQSIIGNKYQVLIEQKNTKGFYEGFTPNYVNVQIKSDRDLTGEIVEVELNKENI